MKHGFSRFQKVRTINPVKLEGLITATIHTRAIGKKSPAAGANQYLIDSMKKHLFVLLACLFAMRIGFENVCDNVKNW